MNWSSGPVSLACGELAKKSPRIQVGYWEAPRPSVRKNAPATLWSRLQVVWQPGHQRCDRPRLHLRFLDGSTGDARSSVEQVDCQVEEAPATVCGWFWELSRGPEVPKHL